LLELLQTLDRQLYIHWYSTSGLTALVAR